MPPRGGVGLERGQSRGVRRGQVFASRFRRQQAGEALPGARCPHSPVLLRYALAKLGDESEAGSVEDDVGCPSELSGEGEDDVGESGVEASASPSSTIVIGGGVSVFGVSLSDLKIVRA